MKLPFSPRCVTKRLAVFVACATLSCSAALGDGDVVDDGGASDLSFAEQCVKAINDHRATIGLAPLARWDDGESCADDEAESDAASNTPHGAFGACGELAQNECPAWPGPAESAIGSCLQQMWAEGPGTDYQAHGHYLNMTDPRFTKVACGVAETGAGSSDRKVWSVQNFR